MTELTLADVEIVPDFAMPPPVPLRDIEWRIDSKPRQSKDGGQVARYVPYIGAARVAQLLDEWAGPGRWWDLYEPGELNGHPVLWCAITVMFPWGTVVRRDVGVPPQGNDPDLSDKGLVSDAFKRCGTLKWGCGRNVYLIPPLTAECAVWENRAYPADGVEEVLVRKLLALGWKPDGTR